MTLIRDQLLDRYLPHARAELEANAWKGDHWRHTDPLELSHEVLYHAAKLDIALRLDDADELVREFGADLANCAAMLLDRLVLLDTQPRDHVDQEDYDSRVGGADLKDHVRQIQEGLAGFVPKEVSA